MGITMAMGTTSYSQSVALNLSMDNATIEEVINRIEKQSEFRFLYNKKMVNVTSRVSISTEDKSISEVLDNLFKNTEISYTISDRQIILNKKDAFTSLPQAPQTKRITGTIVDETTGEAVIGANVLEKGTSNGVVTNFDGEFSISVGENATLRISYIGYIGQDVEVKNQTHLAIVLKEDFQTLNEVVVVGFGTQKKMNLTGAVATVSGEELAKRPVANTATMLQAQIPGLRVTQGKGQPGKETASFRIRGQGTYSSAGSDPLILINGVEGDIATLDPNIIENVSVLKDAASASIYGSRAANGVILVTTKTGAGTKDQVRVSYNGNYAIYQPISVLDLVWDSAEYMKYFNIAKKNSGAAASTLYTDEMIAAYSDPNRDKNQYPSFDWIDYMFQNPFVQTHNVNASGTSSGGKTSYNLSLSYLDQPGTMRGSEYSRLNASIDVTSKINDWIRIGGYFAGSRGNWKETAQGDQDAYLSTISQAPTYKPWLPDDGTGTIRYTHKAYEHEGNNKNMPAIIATNTSRKNVNTDINTQFWLEITPLKGLTWLSKGAARFRHDHDKLYYADPIPQYYYHTGEFSRLLDTRGPGLTSKMTTNTYVNFYSTLKYDIATNDDAHKFSVLGGFSMEKDKYDLLQGYRKEYMFPLEELDAGSTSIQTNEGKSEDWALLSWFGRFNYSFKDRYLFEANARYDGTSRIAKENRWGLFPSFSLGWRLTEEEWMKDLSLTWLNNAKIRGSWGKLGNQKIDLYSYNAVVNPDIAYPFDNNNVSTGVAQTEFSNRSLVWETTTITDIGVDLTMFRGLNITFDWYNKKATDILRRAQATDLLGLKAPYINDGEMENKGIELSVQYNNIISNGGLDGLNYNIGFYVDRTRSKLTKFGAEELEKGMIRREGLPYNSFYVYDAIGIFKDEEEVKNSPKQFTDNTQAGDIKYRDVSGPDGKPDGIINEHDRKIVSGRFPDFEYGINISLNWKGFDLSILTQGVQGIKHYAKDWGVQPFRQGSPPTKDYLKNMWTEENPNGKYPRLYYDNMGGTKNTRESTFYLYDGSYFRMKNLTFGYTLPASITKNILQSCRIYFSADNLFTITKFPQGGDPDRPNDSNNGSRLVFYPQNRILSLGLNVNF